MTVSLLAVRANTPICVLGRCRAGLAPIDHGGAKPRRRR
jgi:hypothetical protein